MLNDDVHDNLSAPEYTTPRSNEALQSSAPAFPVAASLDRLPDEVLATIFWWCCPTYSDRYRSFSNNAVTLSHVCRKWRQVVLQTPSLWTILPLTIHGLEEGSLTGPTDKLQAWLERAHDCPIIIDVDVEETSNKRPPANMLKQVVELIETIAKMKPHLATKAMHFSTSVDAQMIANHPDNLFPDVAESYCWTDTDAVDSPFPPRGSVQLLCMRRSPVIYGLEGHAQIGVAMSRVELRDAHGFIAFCLDECWVLLENFKNLEHCGLRIGGVGPDEEVHDLELPLLKTLALEWRQSAGEGIGLLLDSLSTPSLTDLELRGVLPFRERIVGERWPHLRLFLERNSPPLKILELAKMDCTVLDFAGCLAALSSHRSSELTHLTLSSCLLDAECIRKLWGEEESAKVLNAIRTLMRLESLGMEHCEVYCLEDLVSALCVDYLLWPCARAVISEDHREDLTCALEELFILNCGSLSKDAQRLLDATPVLVEYEEGSPHVVVTGSDVDEEEE